MSDNRQKATPPTKRWKKIVIGLIRWTWIPIVCVVTLFIGLSIGYVYIGKQPMSEVFDLATWRHLFDLIFAST
ncbi:DNA-directed RNA polymerase subunit beta [Paenibacillus validus]|nr:DNA-directed RNA polymerase subunit beta [Paenibacillus validus]MED4600724.1 DNA-directed RNA polymerase subunit beta [Paenibacillus validus]MED4606759.1 DNA-directed RNA polymerase subunit beta [Paenibacillus validus]